MERETGLEPATSSLGSRTSFENKEQLQTWRCILTTASHPESSTYLKTAENGVNGVKFHLPFLAASGAFLSLSPESPNPPFSNGAWRHSCPAKSPLASKESELSLERF